MARVNRQLYYANLVRPDETVKEKYTKGKAVHSLAIFTYQNVCDLRVGDDEIECLAIHFWTDGTDDHVPEVAIEKGTIEVTETKTYKYGRLKGTQYNIYYYSKYGKLIPGEVIDDKRGDRLPYCGPCAPDMTMDELVGAAHENWIQRQVPYTHGYNRCYNCEGFSDAIILYSIERRFAHYIVHEHQKSRLIWDPRKNYEKRAGRNPRIGKMTEEQYHSYRPKYRTYEPIDEDELHHVTLRDARDFSPRQRNDSPLRERDYNDDDDNLLSGGKDKNAKKKKTKRKSKKRKTKRKSNRKLKRKSKKIKKSKRKTKKRKKTKRKSKK